MDNPLLFGVLVFVGVVLLVEGGYLALRAIRQRGEDRGEGRGDPRQERGQEWRQAPPARGRRGGAGRGLASLRRREGAPGSARA